MLKISLHRKVQCIINRERGSVHISEYLKHLSEMKSWCPFVQRRISWSISGIPQWDHPHPTLDPIFSTLTCDYPRSAANKSQSRPHAILLLKVIETMIGACISINTSSCSFLGHKISFVSSLNKIKIFSTNEPKKCFLKQPDEIISPLSSTDELITRVSIHEHKHSEHCLCTKTLLKRRFLNNSLY